MFVYTKRCILKCLSVYLCHQTHTPSVAAFSFWLFFPNFLFILFWALLGLHCCTWAFFGCGEWTSHCGGFSCCRAQALGHRVSGVAHSGLVASRHVGSSQTRDRTPVPCIGRQILNHWTTRETPLFGFLIKHLKCLLILPVLQSYPLWLHNYFISLIFFFPKLISVYSHSFCSVSKPVLLAVQPD